MSWYIERLLHSSLPAASVKERNDKNWIIKMNENALRSDIVKEGVGFPGKERELFTILRVADGEIRKARARVVINTGSALWTVIPHSCRLNLSRHL